MHAGLVWSMDSQIALNDVAIERCLYVANHPQEDVA